MLGYANSIRTIDGGTHIDGVKASLTRTINNLAKKSKVIKVQKIWAHFFSSELFYVEVIIFMLL